MLPADRRKAIISSLRTHGSINNEELAATLHVSLDTIRRDLRLLSANGLITRTHGGAVWSDTREIAYELHRDPNLEYKRKIASRALDYVRPGETVAIDMGTTNVQFARALFNTKRCRPLTVYTVDLRIAMILARAKGILANVVGGVIGERNYLWGSLTKQILDSMVFDTLFLSASGISTENGLTEPYRDVAEVKKALIRNAKRIVLLADHSKFGRKFEMSVATLEPLNVVITDPLCPEDTLTKLRASGITCVNS